MEVEVVICMVTDEFHFYNSLSISSENLYKFCVYFCLKERKY